MAKTLAELEAELKSMDVVGIRMRFQRGRWLVADADGGHVGVGKTLDDAFEEFLEGDDGDDEDDDEDDDDDDEPEHPLF